MAGSGRFSGRDICLEEPDERDVSEAPASLVEECEGAIDGFPDAEIDERQEVNEDLEQQLEDLGYI
jgi:hypothetical protein